MKSMIALTAAAAIAGTASGQTLYTITAQNSMGTDTLNVLATMPVVDTLAPGAFLWEVDTGSMPVMNFGMTTGASLTDGFFGINVDGSGSVTDAPSITLNFAVAAGAADTTFTITAADVNFTTFISDVVVEASAGVTFTDTGGPGDTVTGTPVDFDPDFYAYFLDGTEFGLVPGPLSSELSASNDEGFSGAGPAPVSTLSAAFSFTVSANDTASGTSFVTVDGIVPAPGAAAALGFAGLVAARRRR